jgi:hypothetical protein
MKTNELTGAALDWAVAECEGISMDPRTRKSAWISYSSDWAQAGLIIEREKIDTVYRPYGDERRSKNRTPDWAASVFSRESNVPYCSGPTPLIAAMRCYVARKLGDEVQLPEELI